MILKFIIENNAISLEDMSNLLGVSQRTIRNDLADIDDFLLTNNFDSLKKETVTNFYLANSQKDVQEIMNKLMISKAPSAENWEEPNFRLATLYTKLFWQKNRITIEYLEKTLSVSRSTINSDLKKLKKILKSMNISILFEIQKGFYLAGSEESKRTLYFNFIKNLLNYNYKAEMLSEDDKSFLTYWIKKVEEELMIEISYSSFNQLIITISIIIQRIQQEKKIINEQKNVMSHLTYEIEIIERNCQLLEKFFNISISNFERLFIAKQFYQAKQIKNEVVYQGYKTDIDILVNKFITKVSQQLGINLITNKELYKQLAIHFQTTMSQSMDDITDLITEETFRNIRTMYLGPYEAVKKTVTSLNCPKDLPFNNEKELSFLTLHIVSAIEKLKTDISKKLKVALVCHMGIGTSQFLKQRLAHFFKFHPVVISKKDLAQSKADTDLIISTVTLDDLGIPAVKVSPYLTDIEIEKIRMLEEAVIQTKIECWKQGRLEGRYEPMLKDLLTSNTIETQVHAANWQEAIQISGKVLEKTGAIDNRYTAAMIKAVENFGPYIVIAPHIALAHASSKDGVNRIGMSLITLDEGVEFGNAENDPVKIVICLAAIDHHTHLKALSELVEALNNQVFVDTVLKADKIEIISAINKI